MARPQGISCSRFVPLGAIHKVNQEKCADKDQAGSSEPESNPGESSAGVGVSGTCVMQLFAKLSSPWTPTVSCLLRAQQLHHLWLTWLAHKGAPQGWGPGFGPPAIVPVPLLKD